MAETNQTRIIKIEIDTGPAEHAAISIKSLADANKKLREERKLLDITTREGQQAIEAINKSIDRNDTLIKQNSSSLEKQRLNVGNYTQSIKAAIPALDGMTGGAASAAQGVAAMTKSGLAFISTPIGAVIGAVGLALAALTAYFKGSEEGQNNLNKILAVGTVLFERFQDVLEGVGQALFNATTASTKWGLAIKLAFLPVTIAIENVKLLAAAFEQFFPETAASIKNFVNGVTEDAAKIAKLQADIDADERQLTKQRAATQLLVSQLRQKSAQSDGAEKKAYIEKAIQLETDLAEAETKHAIMARDLAAENVRIKGTDKASLEALADAEAKVSLARASQFENTLKMQKELEAIRDKETAAAEKKKLDQQAAADAEMAANIAFQKRTKEDEEKAIDADAKRKTRSDKALSEELARIQARTDAELKALTEQEKLTADIEASKQRIIAQNLAVARSAVGLSNVLSSLAAKGSAEQRALAIVSIATNAGIGISEAVKAGAGLVWPANLAAILSGVTAVLAGISQAKGVLGFAGGGYTGEGDKYSPAGVVHRNEFVIPSETVNTFGADYFNRYLPGYSDGGLVTNQATSDVNSQIALMNMIRMLPIPEVSVVEIAKETNRVRLKQANSSA